MRSFAQEFCHQFYCHRRTDVVCVWLECQAPNCNPLLAQHPEGFPDYLQKKLFLSSVYALDFLEQIERSAKPLADRNECGNIFGKTGTAVADPSVEEITANAMVHSNSVGDFFDVGAARLTNGRHRVNIRNLQRQE